MAKREKKPVPESFEVVNGEVCPLPDRDIQDGYMPASNPQSRENQMINLATNLAEKQLRDGTASSQVMVHYLKLATDRERMEREVLEKQILLLTAKTDSITSSKENEGLYMKAIEAMKAYGSS